METGSVSTSALPGSFRPEEALRPEDAFLHEALLYSGEDGFVAVALPFIEDGLADEDAVMVVVSGHKIDLLRRHLGEDADRVRFADMNEVGGNPARIIPAWHEFVVDHAGPGCRPRGIGEPVYPERSPAELAECQIHESLLNVAFHDGPPWSLACPYDTAALDATVVEAARRSHPVVLNGRGEPESGDYRYSSDPDEIFAAPLPEPEREPAELVFGRDPLRRLRSFVARHAVGAQLGERAMGDLLLAVHEVATNSLLHGGGQGALRVWQDDGSLVCEIRDGGRIGHPLVGRRPPTGEQEGGRGLWLANQLCDLVQVRSGPGGTVVRLCKRGA